MYYLLNKYVGLRRYSDIGCCYVRQSEDGYWEITEEEFIFLHKILEDGGRTRLDDGDPMVKSFVQERVITPFHTRQDENQNNYYKWQCVECDTPFIEEMEVAITQDCNFNCAYCFEAKDLNKNKSAFTVEEFTNLMDEAVECGYLKIALTGGEPLIHPDFLTILQIVYARGLYVSEILTNASMLDRQMLEVIQAISPIRLPKLCISYDGVGYQNEIRGKNSESKVLNAISLGKDMGYEIMVSINITKYNVSCLFETIELLNNMKVDRIRIVRTMPAPKWLENHADSEYEHDEWYDLAFSALNNLMNCVLNSRGPHSKNFFVLTSHIDFWEVFDLDPIHKIVSMSSNRAMSCDRRGIEYEPLCPLASMRTCVTGEGDLVPCQQVSGILKLEGISLGNVKKNKLKDLLQNSGYRDFLDLRISDRLTKIEKCSNCVHWSKCLGGCPIVSWKWVHEDGDVFPFYTDVTTCAYFEKGFNEKVKKIVKPYIDHDGWRVFGLY